MDKLLYKITVIVLKILPMLLAFITLLNSILSYFNIRLEACRHLRVSETKFNMLRRKGLISEDTKKAGDVRKWSIEELDKYIKENC